jgi:hypothetical protein
MHYSECDCYVGRARQELCTKYESGASIGYGTLGTFLGILTVIGLYALFECILSKDLLCCCVEKGKQTEEVKVTNKIEKNNKDVPDVKVIPMIKETKYKRIGNHTLGHKHRKCWACEVKYNGVPPPKFW